MLPRPIRGAAAGIAATLAMSVWMRAFERIGVMEGQPPRMLVDRLVGVDDDAAADGIALASHLAYGGAAGAAFALLPGRSGPGPGVGFGVALWAAGYEGWMPMLRVLPPAHRDQRGRVLVMIAAHAVYGGVLGALLRR